MLGMYISNRSCKMGTSYIHGNAFLFQLEAMTKLMITCCLFMEASMKSK